MANKKEIITYATVLIFMVVFVVVADGKSKNVNNWLNKLNLLPKQETFTELYFDDYSKLPTKTIAGKNVNFSFTVNNLEEEDMVYPYRVYFEYPSGYKSVIKQGQINLKNKEHISILVSYTFPTSNMYGRLVVKLDNINQSIHFLLPNYN